MGANIAIMIVKAVRPYIKAWLEAEVKKTTSPIDDNVAAIVIGVLYAL